MTNRFHVTFGQKYAHEQHPLFEGAHPHALLEVHAQDEAEARSRVIDAIGTHWAFIYPHTAGMDTKPSPFAPGLMFPRGVTHIIDTNGLRRVDAHTV